MKMCIYLFFLIPIVAISQPSAIAYQTILQDKNGDKLIALETEVQVVLRAVSATGSIIYSELHSTTTGLNGEVMLEIGRGAPESVDFREVDFTQALFAELNYKPSNYPDFVSNGGSELLAVPYAMFSLRTKCEQGCPGEVGVDGPQGADGPAGPQGPSGANGAQGLQGGQGPQGPAGIHNLRPRDTAPTNPYETQLYMDDGTNRADGRIGLRHFSNGGWTDL